MDRVVILGSASAVPDAEHENTHMLVEAGSHLILVDCPGSPIVRLERAGVDPSRVTDVILTHFHPDHVSGFAPFLMGMWLLGRKTVLNVYGLEPTIDRARAMMDLYDWDHWPEFYPVNFYIVKAEERAEVFKDTGLRVTASPVDHLIPAIGLRFDIGNHAMAYSCDTQPSEVVRRLAEGVDVLIHESTGSSVGHTPPEKAGEIAARAGVRSLYLIHYPPKLVEPDSLLEKARQTFDGKVYVAIDFMEIPIG